VILDILENCWEQFQLWLAENPPIPAANDNPGPRSPYEGTPL
jgi:hypothetical protein